MLSPSEEQALPPFDLSEEQAVVTFNHAAEEIRFFKSQQWHVTNYALIAYAALVAAPAWVEVHSWRSWASWGALGLVWLAAAAALRVLANLGKVTCQGTRKAACGATPPIVDARNSRRVFAKGPIEDAVEAQVLEEARPPAGH